RRNSVHDVLYPSMKGQHASPHPTVTLPIGFGPRTFVDNKASNWLRSVYFNCDPQSQTQTIPPQRCVTNKLRVTRKPQQISILRPAHFTASSSTRFFTNHSNSPLTSIAICNNIITDRNMTLGEKLRYLREVEGALRGLDRELSQAELAR